MIYIEKWMCSLVALFPRLSSRRRSPPRCCCCFCYSTEAVRPRLALCVSHAHIPHFTRPSSTPPFFPRVIGRSTHTPPLPKRNEGAGRRHKGGAGTRRQAAQHKNLSTSFKVCCCCRRPAPVLACVVAPPVPLHPALFPAVGWHQPTAGAEGGALLSHSAPPPRAGATQTHPRACPPSLHTDTHRYAPTDRQQIKTPYPTARRTPTAKPLKPLSPS